MGLQIEDGRGTGNSAGVNKEGRLSVNSITSSSEHHSNHCDQTAYNLNFSATPAGPDDCFLYIKNESETDLIIEGFSLWLVADEYIDCKLSDAGVPIGGSDVVPVNLNSGSANSAEGTFQSGSDITGLSGGKVAERIRHASSNESTQINFEQDIILVKNGIFTMYAGTGTTELEGSIYFNYHDCDI